MFDTFSRDMVDWSAYAYVLQPEIVAIILIAGLALLITLFVLCEIDGSIMFCCIIALNMLIVAYDYVTVDFLALPDARSTYYSDEIEKAYNVEVNNKVIKCHPIDANGHILTGAPIVVNTGKGTYNVYLIEDMDGNNKTSLYKKTGDSSYSLVKPEQLKEGTFDSI